ncbi:propionyl-CoA carboxylase alpha chain [Micromonospora pattaloongensis]|uniref:Propionyl-CoA carboxylase alpha chain n=1 Tax=Micromonospora pattaloongensis TaxID=405436 RepID=A0A1H3HC29_9ACTN|nr:biotin carboxylase N-terminal domain-containing protein [Micromonospora pattaloongensis]SDY13041.1 propionyl-CoA carboxylase alpha chain [Micromonospora pattaloongensis]
MIRRLLVADRGEIARRVFATCRLIGIETVAVYSDADVDAPHVAEADYAVRLPGETAAETYLRGDLIVAAARRTAADAIHPGYGFLAENAEFAAAVVDAGLTWVGPPPEVVAAMGSKIGAKARLAEAGVPMLPTWTDATEVAEFPVLVKASAGGGGRGLRIVHDPETLPGAIASARREAAAAFGDGTVFLERYVERARHVEVQIVADARGTVVPFGERECSIQRRHQKIVEETPSAAVTPELRERLCAAAVAASRAVGYVGAGTVEFLLAPDGEFYFLEMNTRLQVEHAVTECVTGFDLVRLQLLVAEGNPLPITTPPPMRGHAIEARLCAEDPAYAWLPSTGTLHRFDVPDVAGRFRPLTRPGLRLDAGVRDGAVVGVHYDSMFAKLVAWAPTRYEAARLLAAALTRARIHGVVTNRDLLVRILRHPSFRSGAIDTAFLDDHPEVFAPLLSSIDAVRVSCLAAALAGAAARRAAAPVLAGIPSGWRNVPATPQISLYDGPSGPVEVGYRLDRAGELARWWVRSIDPDELDIAGLGQPTVTDDHPPVTVVSATGERVVLNVDGTRLDFDVHRVEETSYVDSPEGSVRLTELPRFPEPATEVAEGSLVAPLPGAVGRVLVVPGQRVNAGELLMTLEAMKLEHPVHAPSSGVVSALPVSAGAQVDTGAVLAVLTPE